MDAVDDLGDMIGGDFTVGVTDETSIVTRKMMMMMIVSDHRLIVGSDMDIVIFDRQESIGFAEDASAFSLDEEALRGSSEVGDRDVFRLGDLGETFED
jgi:hypothetical protein